MSEASTSPVVSSGDDAESRFNYIDYLVLAGMLVLSAIVGVYFGAKVKSMAEYLTGDRKMKTVPISISLIAR